MDRPAFDLSDIAALLEGSTSDLRDLNENLEARQIARLIKRRDEIDREWTELEEAGKLTYFGTGCLKPWPYSLNCERIRIVARLIELGIDFESAQAGNP